MSAEGPGTRRKALIGAASATQAVSGGMLGTTLVVYVGRDGSPFAVSMLAAVFFASSMLFAPLWGSVGDLLGRRRTLLLCLSGLTTLVTFGFLAAENTWGLVGLRGLRAVFAVGFAPLVLSMVRALVGQARRGRSVGFVSSTSAVGDVVAQLTVGILLGILVPTGVFLLIAVLSGVTTVLLAFFRDPVNGDGQRPAVRELLSTARTRLVPDRSERERLRHTGLTWLYGGIALRHIAVQGVGSLVPIYLVSRLGFPTVFMGAVLAIRPAAQIGFMPLFGRLADRGTRKRLIVGGILLSAAYTLILAVATALSGQSVRTGVVALGFVVIAAGFSAMDVGAVSVIGDSVPESRESAFIGLRSTAAGVGGVLGPLFVGATATLAGFEVAFAVASVFAFAAAALVSAKFEEPAPKTAPATAFGAVELSTGPTQPPGTHRGEDAGGTRTDPKLRDASERQE